MSAAAELRDAAANNGKDAIGPNVSGSSARRLGNWRHQNRHIGRRDFDVAAGCVIGRCLLARGDRWQRDGNRVSITKDDPVVAAWGSPGEDGYLVGR